MSAVPAQLPVLIVGSGPVGLTMSILLSRLGIRCLLVERHAAPSRHPRGRAISTRTMEVLRELGLEADVRAASLAAERDGLHYFFATTLTAADYRRIHGGLSQQRAQLSPTSAVVCPQVTLEPILRAHAEQLAPGHVRFNTELASFHQDAKGVTAHLVDRANGASRTVRAAYLVAADGARSGTRGALGIALVGANGLSHNLSILFEADLKPWVEQRRSIIYFIDIPQARGYFLPVDGRRWVFNLVVDAELRNNDVGEQRCEHTIRTAIGQAPIPVQILEWQAWTARSEVAERFSAGRVLLAGDAAHIVTPYSAAGMNLGVQDAHNLAWKLAGVLSGWASPALLATYDAERRPIAEWTAEEDRRTIAAALGTAQAAASWEQWSRELTKRRMNHGLVLGYRYESPAVVPDGTPPPAVADPFAHYVPTARPGHRAPHVWLEAGGQRVSTLDLFGTGFVLLTGVEGHAWASVARTAAGWLGVPLAVRTVGQDTLSDHDGAWATTYGVDEDGAVLVRPDGHVAWRCPHAPAQPEDALITTLQAVLGRAPAARRARMKEHP
jgi:putative polyketide hydroxylase